MSSNHREYKGKNIEEAIAKAESDLNTTRDELEVEVVSAGSPGIFGIGKKKAIVLVSRKAMLEEPQSPRSPQAPTPGHKSSHHNKSTKDTGRVKSPERRDHEAYKPEEHPIPAQAVIEEIKELTQTFLRLMGYPLDVTMSTKGNKLTAHIGIGQGASEIIGRDGSVLDAIQYLLRKMITQRYTEKIVLSLDAGTYREDRQKELEALALSMAAKVKETGKSQIMSALNPAERRIVHVTLQDDSAIRSASIGEGLFKKVRIYLPGKGRKRSTGRPRSRQATEVAVPLES